METKTCDFELYARSSVKAKDVKVRPGVMNEVRRRTVKARLIEENMIVVMVLLQQIRSSRGRLGADARDMIHPAVFQRQLYSGGGCHCYCSVRIDSRSRH
jgi:hypothetical protein